MSRTSRRAPRSTTPQSRPPSPWTAYPPPREKGIELDTWDTPQGSAWRGRAEHYLTDPSQEPDPAKLETDVAFLIREA